MQTINWTTCPTSRYCLRFPAGHYASELARNSLLWNASDDCRNGGASRITQQHCTISIIFSYLPCCMFTLGVVISFLSPHKSNQVCPMFVCWAWLSGSQPPTSHTNGIIPFLWGSGMHLFHPLNYSLLSSFSCLECHYPYTEYSTSVIT